MSHKKLLAVEQARRIANALSGAVELMAGRSAFANVKESTFDALDRISSPLILKCSFGSRDAALLVVAAHEAWSSIADASVAGAGIEQTDDDLRQETWRELVSQAVSPLVSPQFHILKVVAVPGNQEFLATISSSEVTSLEVLMGDNPLSTFFLVWDGIFLESLGADPTVDAESLSECIRPASLDRLLDIELPLSVSFGRTHLAVQDVLKLSTGSIIELNCLANDLVEIVVNNCMIARGEVVVIEGNYGVRIREIISRGDRLALQSSRTVTHSESRRSSA